MLIRVVGEGRTVLLILRRSTSRIIGSLTPRALLQLIAEEVELQMGLDWHREVRDDATGGTAIPNHSSSPGMQALLTDGEGPRAIAVGIWWRVADSDQVLERVS